MKPENEMTPRLQERSTTEEKEAVKTGTRKTTRTKKEGSLREVVADIVEDLGTDSKNMKDVQSSEHPTFELDYLNRKYGEDNILPQEPEALYAEAERRGLLDPVNRLADTIFTDALTDISENQLMLMRYATGGEQLYMKLAKFLPERMREKVDSSVAENISRDLIPRMEKKWKAGIKYFEKKIGTFKAKKASLEHERITLGHDILLADQAAVSAEEEVSKLELELEELERDHDMAVRNNIETMYPSIIEKKISTSTQLDTARYRVISLADSLRRLEQKKEQCDVKLSAYAMAIARLQSVRREYNEMCLDLETMTNYDQDLAPLLNQQDPDSVKEALGTVDDIEYVRAEKKRKLETLESELSKMSVEGRTRAKGKGLELRLPSYESIQEREYKESVRYLEKRRKGKQ